MSLLAMVAAALGFLPPAVGALLQEGSDAAVTLNALRALTGGRRRGVTITPATERLLHGRAEEAQLYPALAAPLGSPDATAPMSRVHAEIERLTRRLGTHLAQIDASGRLDPGRVEDLLACLYGLPAVLTLHFVLASTNPAGQA
jgi:hypothetical protein